MLCIVHYIVVYKIYIYDIRAYTVYISQVGLVLFLCFFFSLDEMTVSFLVHILCTIFEIYRRACNMIEHGKQIYI